ncbi:MAG: SRPBCC family protein [Thermomicrobiales bacterium]|nr:SRPBCC family protein [Thermomicrobiales bacterium]
MAEYQRERHIDVAPDDVFAFVSDVNNLHTYVPTVKEAESIGDGRIRVRGEIGGQRYEDEGQFNAEPARRRIEWRVEDREYAGWLSVHGDNGGSLVTVRLLASPYYTESGRPITGVAPAEKDPIEDELEDALDELRRLMEGFGGTVHPAATG